MNEIELEDYTKTKKEQERVARLEKNNNLLMMYVMPMINVKIKVM